MVEKSIISIPTEQFKRLPDTKLHILKVEILGLDDQWFKSLCSKNLVKIENAFKAIYGENSIELNEVEFFYDTFTCKNTTIYSDENCIMDGIHSFKGKLV